MILKMGDDLRQDMACLQCFRFMNYLWREDNLHFGPQRQYVQTFVYGCLALTPKIGLIECVPRCHPLKTIKELSVKFGEYDLDRMIASASASYISAYVLGIRDRHYDNILIRHDGILFHIDFGFILGNKTSGLDTARFAITPDLEMVMGKEKYLHFIDLCVQCFASLRKHDAVLIDYIVTMLRVLPEMNELKIRDFLRESLLLSLNLNEACATLRKKILDAPTSVKTKIKNAVHGFVAS